MGCKLINLFDGLEEKVPFLNRLGFMVDGIGQVPADGSLGVQRCCDEGERSDGARGER